MISDPCPMDLSAPQRQQEISVFGKTLWCSKMLQVLNGQQLQLNYPMVFLRFFSCSMLRLRSHLSEVCTGDFSKMKERKDQVMESAAFTKVRCNGLFGASALLLFLFFLLCFL